MHLPIHQTPAGVPVARPQHSVPPHSGAQTKSSPSWSSPVGVRGGANSQPPTMYNQNWAQETAVPKRERGPRLTTLNVATRLDLRAVFEPHICL